MYVLIEDSGKFLTGRVLSETDTSAQVELDSGKRLKVKLTQVMLRFEKPSPHELMADGLALSESIELDLAWEFAPEEEFGFEEFAKEYFNASASLIQQAASLFRLFDTPHYFRRVGKGRFKKASADILKQALATIEKKKLLQEQIQAWAQELAQEKCPTPIAEQLYKILFKPDKNAPEYKAVVEASKTTKIAPLTLLQKTGAISSPYQFHWQRFLFENFPKGTGFLNLHSPAIKLDLPLATVHAYSIDDSQTTEIDDALSVQGLQTGVVTVGIHIAAPALALKPSDAIDQCARTRLSTVYMPGHKITMLPSHVVESFTLQEGKNCPAVSLYVSFNEETLEVLSSITKIEQVSITANLRHDQLEDLVTESWLSANAPSDAAQTTTPHLPQLELSFLFRLAQNLKSKREVVRGKPENFNRPDYNFRIVDAPEDGPLGTENVVITQRQRGTPLDLIVAETMILANSTWGRWMADLGVPAIYRSQVSIAPGVKVRMSTKALPHAGIGVGCYAWSTSPLRRYTDLVNQWQIIACAQNGTTAALVAPFKPKDTELFAIISSFDAAYTAYNQHQASMERFWTLQHVKQHSIDQIDAQVFKSFPGTPPMARADHLPLVLSILNAPPLDRGTPIKVRIGDIDDISLDLQAHYLETLMSRQASLKQTDEIEEGDDNSSAGPIAIAIDMSDESTETTQTTPILEKGNPISP